MVRTMLIMIVMAALAQDRRQWNSHSSFHALSLDNRCEEVGTHAIETAALSVRESASAGKLTAKNIQEPSR